MNLRMRFAIFHNGSCSLIAHTHRVMVGDDGSVRLTGIVENGCWSFQADMLRGTMEWEYPSGTERVSGCSFIDLEHIPGVDPSWHYNEVLNYIQTTKFNPRTRSFVSRSHVKLVVSTVRIFYHRFFLACAAFWGVMSGKKVFFREAPRPFSKPDEDDEDDSIPF